MFSRYLIEDSGSTNLFPGEIVEEEVLMQANKEFKSAKEKLKLVDYY